MATEMTSLVNGMTIENGASAHSDSGQTSENSWWSNNIKTIVIGGLDGLLANFAIISACFGADIPWSVGVIITGSFTIASALTLFANEFFASSAHRDYILSERRRAIWKFRTYRDEEYSEMVSKFVHKGVSKNDAELIVNKMVQYQDVFVDTKLVFDLGLLSPIDDDPSLLTDSFLLFFAYFFTSLLSVAMFALPYVIPLSSFHNYVVSCGWSCMMGLIFASMKWSFSSKHWFYCLLETFFLLLLSSSMAYFLGYQLSNILEIYLPF